MNVGACSYCGEFHTAVNSACPNITPVSWPRDCIHGSLARSCEICDLNARVEEAREMYSKARSMWQESDVAKIVAEIELSRLRGIVERAKVIHQSIEVTGIDSKRGGTFYCRECDQYTETSCQTLAILSETTQGVDNE